jgi:hypothetical protein
MNNLHEILSSSFFFFSFDFVLTGIQQVKSSESQRF